MANEKGGVDNITVVVVDITDPGSSRRQSEQGTETAASIGGKKP